MKKITFRTQTKSEIDDLMSDEGLQCAVSQALINALVGELLHYAEEGRLLTPSVMYCEHAAEVIAAFPAAVRYDIGTVPLSEEAGRKILKLCAPLAGGNWYIFIERADAQTLRFGVFKYPMLPTTAPLHENLEIAGGEHFAIVIRKTSFASVEVRGSRGCHVNFMFSTIRDDAPEAQPIADFAKECCAATSGDGEHEAFQNYFSRMLERVLTACHGTILVCGSEEALTQEQTLHDVTWLKPPLDFWKAFKEYRSLDSSQSVLELQHLEELLAGLMNSDGMVVFYNDGTVLAYRMFYSGNAPIAAATGGARRRAFEGVKGLLGGPVRAVLFRSEDGNMLFAGGEQ